MRKIGQFGVYKNFCKICVRAINKSWPNMPTFDTIYPMKFVGMVTNSYKSMADSHFESICRELVHLTADEKEAIKIEMLEAVNDLLAKLQEM